MPRCADDRGGVAGLYRPGADARPPRALAPGPGRRRGPHPQVAPLRLRLLPPRLGGHRGRAGLAGGGGHRALRRWPHQPRRRPAGSRRLPAGPPGASGPPWQALGAIPGPDVYRAARVAQQDAILVRSDSSPQEEAAQAELLRCIGGNPFRPVRCDPAWLAPTVVRLARGAYDERLLPSGHLDPQRLQVLADALEEAGCEYADVLG